ncbi:MAG TPA: POTRA domain-containing protein [Polyangiaceae bacterium]
MTRRIPNAAWSDRRVRLAGAAVIRIEPMSTARVLRLAALVVALASLVAGPAPVRADEPSAPPGGQSAPSRVPALAPAPALDELAGKPISAIEIRLVGSDAPPAVTLQQAKVGQVFSPEVARLAMQELLDTGRYADVGATVEAAGSGVLLRLSALPRYVIARVEVSGSPLPVEELLKAESVKVGDDITVPDLPRVAKLLRAELERRGFPDAEVKVSAMDTDDPLEAIVNVEVQAGRATKVQELLFGVWPDPEVPGLRELLKGYTVREGDRADAETLALADRELETKLKARGWHRASVNHRVDRRPGRALVRVQVSAGPLMRLVFEGNRRFDAATLEAALELEETEEPDPIVLVERLHDFYENRGFLDANVLSAERGAPNAGVHDLVFLIHEGDLVRVVAREYPCLSGERTPSEVGSEIDSFLSELPGSELVSGIDDNVANDLYGPTTRHGTRRTPLALNPWSSYVGDAYDKAIEHLKDLFRSQGYLSATVGPPTLTRRACDPNSPPGACKPIGPRKRPRTECRYDAIGLPLAEPPLDPSETCTPNLARGKRCEPEAVLHLPIKLGPRTFLYDIAFEGNRLLVEKELAEAAELELGAPVSHVELEQARRRVLDAYAEEGFAFAEVDTTLDLSADHTRGRAHFVISERDRVKISRIVVRGARLTNEGLIRDRIALSEGGLYRRSLVRRTEEQLAQLGVFSSVSIGFEDPYIPAREKVVLVTVEERKPFTLDAQAGVSSGEGIRGGFEFGHRNIAGQAIRLTVAIRLSYLPDAFILEPDVRQNYDELPVIERLERHNTLTLEFPGIGLGPMFPLSLDGVDVRDNARDYGITKDAAIITLHFRPTRRLAFALGASIERNNAAIFGKEGKGALEDYVQDNPSARNTFHVPEGLTRAIAEQARAAWDRRDNPLDATRGTLISLGAEHVHADPLEETDPTDTSVFAPTVSDFMRYDGRVAGYIRLSQRGLALALSLRVGVIQQLIDNSRTYPDRLFFLGGADSIRGYTQDSLVPQDIADQLLSPDDPLSIDEVVIRGGDAFVNPRAELRIPLTGSVQTTLFVDAGNLWTDPSLMQPFDLRYTTGTGLRIGTPVGPLVFDYGFNVDRVLDQLFPERTPRRYWEALGAFHFSIGLL